METRNLALRAKKILEKYPKADGVFFTADGSAFVDERQANLHAKGLEDKEVTTVSKEEANATGEDSAPAGNQEPTVKPLNKMNLEELNGEVAKREGLVLKPESKTKKDIVAEIEEWDAAQEAAKGAAATAEGNTPVVGDETKQ